MIGWRELVAEFVGTALLLMFGVSAIVVDFAPGSPQSWSVNRIRSSIM